MLTKTDREAIASYFEDSSNVKGGWADSLVVPERVGEIQDLLSRASREKTPVTIAGGGTGTTGGRVPFGGTVLSLERLNKIICVARAPAAGAGGTGKAQAGVSVDDFKKAADAHGLFYTCHPTEGTASLGGTVATNASGARSFRYGATRESVRALQIVLATGELLNVRRGETVLTSARSKLTLESGRVIDVPLPTYRMPQVKHAAGYYAKDGLDVIDLFIGSEGTLGVVTEVELALAPKPEEIFACVAFFAHEEESWKFASDSRALNPLSIEYFDTHAIRMIASRGFALPPRAQAAILFEHEISEKSAADTIDAWQRLLARFRIPEEEVWAATTEREAHKFIEIRHSIPSAINEVFRARGFQKISTDIAVPEARFVEMMRFYGDAFKSDALEHVIFGHIGESHVHVNILPRSEEEAFRAKALAASFVEKAVSLGGTVSAEHGIGKIKHVYLEALYGKKGVLEMARLKKAFDPACILGLDTIFPRSLLKEVSV